jgi:hypothetical protein
MDENKHTPGPWKLLVREILEDGSVYPSHIVGGPRELQVCLLESSTVAKIATEDYSGSWGVNKANARLIAAAPELLEALKRAVSAGIIDINGEPELARAAIAKATLGANRDSEEL